MPKDWSDEFVHHWKYFVGPARPGSSELEKIKQKILEKGKDAKVLILGSTSEYRNLCGELGIPLTLLDFKKYNYEYLSDEVKNKPEERFIEGDWMHTVLDEKFDIILADNVLNVVASKENVKIVLRNAAKMLKKDGLFMPRTYIRRKGERIDPEKVVRLYRKKWDGKDLYTWISRDFYVASYDFNKDYVVLKNVWKLLKSLHDKGLFTDEEMKYWQRLSYKDREFYFHVPVKEEHEKLLSEFFDIDEIFNGTEEYLKGDVPLYILRLKK